MFEAEPRPSLQYHIWVGEGWTQLASFGYIKAGTASVGHKAAKSPRSCVLLVRRLQSTRHQETPESHGKLFPTPVTDAACEALALGWPGPCLD